MAKEKTTKETGKDNPMRTIKIEKIVLSVGGVEDVLHKGFRLLEILTERKPMKTKSRKRIPSLGVRPGLEVGALVTIREDFEPMLKKLLVAVENTVKRKQVSENTFSFGIKEYIEIPGQEYQREIGIIGLDVTVTFTRAGKRVKLKKIRSGKLPDKQMISKEEIIKFMEDNFQTKFVGK